MKQTFEDILFGLVFPVLVGTISYIVGISDGQKQACKAYVAEQVRIETQAKEYQRRFDDWCQTMKHKCRMK